MTNPSQGGLDLERLEREWKQYSETSGAAITILALIDRVRELSTENAKLTKDIRHRVRFSEWSPTEAEFESYRDDTEARLASLERVREAAVDYYNRPQSREFEEALRAALADSEKANG